MNKQARAAVEESLHENDPKARGKDQRLQLSESEIRMQLAEFAKEIDLLKQLHKKH